MTSSSHSGAPRKPIGILGGTFDPVHYGHLRLAIEAHEALDLDHVRLMPLHSPGHREAPIASPATRLEMVRAVKGPPIEIEACEVERGGTTYTVDTLMQLKNDWPDRSLCLLMGLDAYASLPAWHRADELLGLAHIVVAARPEADYQMHPGLDELIGNAHADSVKELHDSTAGRVFFLDIPLLPIAGSDLRQRTATGRDIRHLVPDAVCAIIAKEGLYKA